LEWAIYHLEADKEKENDRPLAVFLTRGARVEVQPAEGQDAIASWECRRNNVLRK